MSSDCPECARFPARLDDLVGWRHFHGEAACWFLVVEVYARHLGIMLPHRNLVEPQDEWRNLINAGAQQFERVETPRPYDCVLLRFETGDHIGLMLDERDVVHFHRPAAGVCRHPLARLSRYLIGVYRYAGT